MSDYLFFMYHAHGVEILSFVLMDNHFHLIAKFPRGNMAEATQYFMRETSRCIAGSSHRVNHVYGGRIFRSRIHEERYLHHAYKYVYRNPVEGKLAGSVEDYPFSTLRAVLGREKGIIPLCEDFVLFGNETVRVLDWLNHAPSEKNLEAVRSALRKRQMTLPRRKSRRPHKLESESY